MPFRKVYLLAIFELLKAIPSMGFMKSRISKECKQFKTDRLHIYETLVFCVDSGFSSKLFVEAISRVFLIMLMSPFKSFASSGTHHFF